MDNQTRVGMDHNTRDVLSKLKNKVSHRKGGKKSEYAALCSRGTVPLEMHGSLLTCSQREIYRLIMGYASLCGVAWPRRKLLSALSDIGERSISTIVSRLVKEGFLMFLMYKDRYGTKCFYIPKHRADQAIMEFSQMGEHEFAAEIGKYFDIHVSCAGIAKRASHTLRKDLKNSLAHEAKGEQEEYKRGETHTKSSDPCNLYSKPPTSVEETTSRACAREEVGSDDPPPDAAGSFFEENEERQEVREEAKELMESMPWPPEKALRGAHLWHSLSAEQICKLQARPGHVKEKWIRWMIDHNKDDLETNRNQGMKKDFEENVRTAKVFVKEFREDQSDYTKKFTEVHLNATGLEIYPKSAADTLVNNYFLDFRMKRDVFVKKLLEAGEKRKLLSCPLFDSLRSQLLSLVPDAPGQGSTTPRSTAREQWPSSSSPRHQGSTLTPDRSMSSSSSPSRYPPQQAKRSAQHSTAGPTSGSRTYQTSSNTQRTLSTDFSGRTTSKSLTSELGKFTEAIPEQKSGWVPSIATSSFLKEL